MVEVSYLNLISLLPPDRPRHEGVWIDFHGRQLAAGTKCRAKLDEEIWIRVLEDTDLPYQNVSRVPEVKARKVDDLGQCMADLEKIMMEKRFYRLRATDRVLTFKMFSEMHEISELHSALGAKYRTLEDKDRPKRSFSDLENEQRWFVVLQGLLPEL